MHVYLFQQSYRLCIVIHPLVLTCSSRAIACALSYTLWFSPVPAELSPVHCRTPSGSHLFQQSYRLCIVVHPLVLTCSSRAIACALSYTLWKVSESRAMNRFSPTTAMNTRKVSTSMAAMASSMVRTDCQKR